MTVEVRFCDVCLELECVDEDECAAERERMAAACDVCGEVECDDDEHVRFAQMINDEREQA